MPQRTEQRRKTVATRSALLDEATQRLITHSLDALTGLVTPSAIARSTAATSVDTAYRLLKSPEETVLLLANRVISPSFSSAELNWPSFGQITNSTFETLGGISSLDGIHAALCALIRNNLYLPSFVIGRTMDAITITASDAWVGDLRIRPDREAIAKAIRSARLEAIRELDRELAWALHIALVQLRRRPREGQSQESMVILLRALAEGGLDRILNDPESLDVEQIATAMIDLGLALSEDGLLHETLARFEVSEGFPLGAILLAAERIWPSTSSDDLLQSVADEVGISLATLIETFPTVGLLADAVLTSTVIGPPITGSAESRFILFTAALHRLAQVADSCPTLVAAASGPEMAGATVAELTAIAVELVQHSDPNRREPERFADQLVSNAKMGMAHWETVRLLLDLLRE